MRLGDDDSSIATAAATLRGGGLVAIPTETVYGLAARGDREAAVAAIFAAKGRPSSNPLILHVADIAAALRLWQPLSDIQTRRLQRLATLWPGPLTVVGPKSSHVLDTVTAGGPTVAVRIPDHPLTLRLLASVPFPVAAPSANPANYVSPTTADHVADQLGDRVEHILDGGPCRVGLESTVVDLGDDQCPPRLLRIGVIGVDQITRILGEPITTAKSSRAIPPSPGMGLKHYSPRIPVRWAEPFTPVPPGTIRLNWTDTDENTLCLSSTGNWSEAAHRFYAALRTADQHYRAIEIQPLPAIESIAVADRPYVLAIADRISRIIKQN